MIVPPRPVTLEELADHIALWGYKVDSDFSGVRAETSPEDYVVISRRGPYFHVDVYDSPTSLLRDLGTFFHTSHMPAKFEMKRQSTKQRKFHGPK